MLRWWPDVTAKTLRADVVAALTGALIVLPQAVAFATIAGLPPQYGLYAAMVPAVVAALFGSSWHLVSGPTTAISIVVYASVSPLAPPGSAQFIGLVLTLTLLTGAIQLVMGVARLGALVDFISHTVILGFTAGAALLIVASQVKNFFGLDIPREAKFHEVVLHLGGNVLAIEPWVLTTSLVTLLAALTAKRWAPKLPYMIVAMVIGSVAAVLISRRLPPEESGIRTEGALPASLPPFSVPDLSPGALEATFFPAAIVAVLALTEAVAISRSVALKSGQRIDSNQEFIGQGLSNIAGSFFSSYTASGSFNRTGVNYAAGARTPLAAVFSAVFLLLILFLVAPLVAYLPVASMAAVLFVVAWGLVDVHHIKPVLVRHPRERIIFLVTFVGTLIDLEKGIFVGILVSLLLYLWRTSRPSVRELVPAADPSEVRRKFVPADSDSPTCPQMTILRVEGSLFFGAVETVTDAFRAADEGGRRKRHLMVSAKPIGFSDRAGCEMLGREAERRRTADGGLYLVGVQPDLAMMLRRSEQDEVIGAENVFARKGDALAAIYPRLDVDTCRECRVRLFRECWLGLPDGTPRPEEGRVSQPRQEPGEAPQPAAAAVGDALALGAVDVSDPVPRASKTTDGSSPSGPTPDQGASS
ncbi:MAG: SulP family inorganic anion transporter [Micrococcales bacterium]|nr:SulP family inorganic anion transporter [Micrococcales bacterium]